MSLKIRIWNTEEDRPANAEEIERLFINYEINGSGYAEIDYLRGNNTAVDPESMDLIVEVV